MNMDDYSVYVTIFCTVLSFVTVLITDCWFITYFSIRQINNNIHQIHNKINLIEQNIDRLQTITSSIKLDESTDLDTVLEDDTGDESDESDDVTTDEPTQIVHESDDELLDDDTDSDGSEKTPIIHNYY